MLRETCIILQGVGGFVTSGRVEQTLPVSSRRGTVFFLTEQEHILDATLTPFSCKVLTLAVRGCATTETCTIVVPVLHVLLLAQARQLLWFPKCAVQFSW